MSMQIPVPRRAARLQLNALFGLVALLAATGSAAAAAPTLTTLVSFNGTNPNGGEPDCGLISDAAGDLFGTTESGGNGYGVVFEIVKTTTGDASTPTTLVSFNDANGRFPAGGSLIADAAGDLFGTATSGRGEWLWRRV